MCVRASAKWAPERTRDVATSPQRPHHQHVVVLVLDNLPQLFRRCLVELCAVELCLVEPARVLRQAQRRQPRHDVVNGGCAGRYCSAREQYTSTHSSVSTDAEDMVGVPMVYPHNTHAR